MKKYLPFIMYYGSALLLFTCKVHCLQTFGTHACTLGHQSLGVCEEMMCHYFFPSCGNSTVFEFPTSVCPSDCEEQRHKCPSQWTWFQQKLSSAMIHQLDNCSNTTFTQNLSHSCSSVGRLYVSFGLLLHLNVNFSSPATGGGQSTYETSGKNHFNEMNGDVGMARWK